MLRSRASAQIDGRHSKGDDDDLHGALAAVVAVTGFRGNPDDLSAAASSWDEQAGALRGFMGQLCELIDQATQAWAGHASKAFTDTSERWNEVMHKSAGTLQNIGENLNSASAEYAGTEDDNKQSFAMNFGEDTFSDSRDAKDGDGKAEAALPVGFKEDGGGGRDSPLGDNDPDKGGPGSADGDPSRGRGNDPVGGHPPEDAEYRIGPAQRPDLKNKDDFEYSSKESNLQDEVEWAKWGALNEGAEDLRPDLDDATEMYSHFRDNTGTPMRFDYEEAYREDDAIRANVNDKIAEAQRAAESLIREGNTSFSMTGGPTAAGNLFTGDGHYPSTEDWQKTIGAYNQWASGDVKVNGDTVTMTVTVHAEDRYNFNRNSADMASGLPDNANGRFEEIGWAKPFDTSGELTRTVTWKLGEAPGTSSVGVSGPDRGSPEGADDPPMTPR